MTEAFQTIRNPDTIAKAQELGAKMIAEEGVVNGVNSFFKNLPIYDMICEVSMFDNKSSCLATVFCSDCSLKMCQEMDSFLHREDGGKDSHSRVPYRPSRWGIVPPENIAKGIKQGFGGAAYEMAGGLYDLFAKPVIRAQEKGAIGAVEVFNFQF
jgi:hypothetical protein